MSSLTRKLRTCPRVAASLLIAFLIGAALVLTIFIIVTLYAS